MSAEKINEDMARVLRVIYTWASFDIDNKNSGGEFRKYCLNSEHVLDLIETVLPAISAQKNLQKTIDK